MGIKLLYFPVPGRAEAIRLLLDGGNVAFEVGSALPCHMFVNVC
jgi:hypothetical protein